MTRAHLFCSLILGGMVGCRQDAPIPESTPREPSRGEHNVLAGSFVSGDSAALGDLLHADVLVQPPSPDTALQGPAARSYLLALAATTRVSDSRLYPRMVVPEGPFVFEQGVWELRSGTRRLFSPYVLRWRNTPAGWRVVLWRWERFR